MVSGRPSDSRVSAQLTVNHEHIVTIQNGNPVLRTLYVAVNGVMFRAGNLRDGAVVVIDVGSAMYRTRDNSITLMPVGTTGESAKVTIGRWSDLEKQSREREPQKL